MQLGNFGSALADVVVHFGYGAVFVLIFLESAGVPLPGETALVTASALAATTEGLDISLIIIAAAAGAILGDNLGFWVGRRYGFDFLRRYGRYVRLTEDRIMICQWLFRQYGGRVVFFGRFTAFLRTYAALLAGALNFPRVEFFLWNASGGIVWAAFFGLGGYMFGHAVKLVAGPVSAALLICAVLGIGALWWVFKRYERQLLAKARGSLAANKWQR
jgi:membrane protein DedA with SNARE-associated domain